MKMLKVLPSDNSRARRALYGGEIFLLEPTSASRRLAAAARACLAGELGRLPRRAQFRLAEEEFFRRAGRLRKLFYTARAFQDAVRDVMASCGFSPGENVFDPPHLRVNARGGHENPKAAPVYYAHRDTWYANPQTQINWWVPLHDVSREETFVFFPAFFARPARNDSERFDYDEWLGADRGRKIGWQDPKAGLEALYPKLLQETPRGRLGFSARAGQILLFSGQHLHQTLPNSARPTRFSVDFRTAHRGDERAGLGARNVDARATGSALKDYL